MNDLQIDSTHIESQKDRLAFALASISHNITAGDRVLCQRHYRLAKSTVARYLLGNVDNLDTGLKLLTFFKRRIEHRKHLIDELCSTPTTD